MFSKIFGWDQKQQEDMSPLPEEFDIIVCGGGSCGCVVAGRYVPCPMIKAIGKKLYTDSAQSGKFGS